MKQKIVMAIVILIAVITQCSIFQIFEVASVKPNILVIVVVSFGLIMGRRCGLLTGFAGGLLMDLLYPHTLGFNALVYMWIGYFAGTFYSIFYDDDIKTPLLMVTCGEMIYTVVYYICYFMMRGRIHFLFYLRRIMIPELLYTIIITLIGYRLIHRIGLWLRKTSKRGTDYFA